MTSDDECDGCGLIYSTKPPWTITPCGGCPRCDDNAPRKAGEEVAAIRKDAGDSKESNKTSPSPAPTQQQKAMHVRRLICELGGHWRQYPCRDDGQPTEFWCVCCQEWVK